MSEQVQDSERRDSIEKVAREFRVRWRREQRSRGTSAIFQTHSGAVAKIDRLLGLEEVKDELPGYEEMPDLDGAPVLEYREVGDWTAHPDQRAEASKETRSEWRAHVHKETEMREGRPSTAVVPWQPTDERDIPF